MTGRNKLKTRSIAERLQAQAELENVAAAEVRRIVDTFMEFRGVTQSEIAKSVGLDPARLSKALYPSNLTLRTLSQIVLACDRELILEALSPDEFLAQAPSNYPLQPVVRPDDPYAEPVSSPASDGTSLVAEFKSVKPPSGDSASRFAEFRR